MLNKITNKAQNLAKSDMASFMYATSIIGWVLSSAAQIVGIKLNKNYSKTEKDYMVKQEYGDVLANVLSYVFITTPIMALIGNLVKTGKYTTKNIAKHIADLEGVRKWGFDTGESIKNLKLTTSERHNLSCEYRQFSDTLRTIGAFTGGVLSCSFAAPIMKNVFASLRHKPETLKKNENPNNIPNPTIQTKPHVSTPRISFNDYKTGVTSLKI